MMALPRLLWLPLAGLLALAAPVQAQRDDERRSPMPGHLPLGTDACFGRSYDAAHLKRHPKQRVAAFHLLRDFTPDRSTEDVPQSAEEMKTDDGQYGSVTVSAFVRFRNRPGTFWHMLSCHRSDDGGVRCGVDCDGGSFSLKPLARGDGLMLENHGFVVAGGCGGDGEENVFVHPGADDRTFRLDRQPVAACLAARDAVKPAWAKLGAPLRERLDRREAVCFSRSYDAAHLARHPQQTVRRFAVLKPDGQAPGEGASHRLSMRIELKDGRRIERPVRCFTERYAYRCIPTQPLRNDDAEFFLTRAGNAGAMVRDRHGRLAALFGVTLDEDDRLFRLNASDASACAL